jgi:CBS domain containing-hemolysin-like protein
VFFAGLFAGAETGIYQVSRLRLRLGIEKKLLSSVILGKALRDTSGLLTSTLVGTNLSIYIVTSAVTYMIMKNSQSAHAAEFLATIITAPPLFIFSELVPKNLFFYYSDTLMLKIAPLLFGFYKLLSWCGIITVFRYISRILAKLTHTPIPSNGVISAVQKHETAAFFNDIHEESFLSTVQTDIVNRLLIVSTTTVGSAMVPLREIQLVSVDSNRQEILEIFRKRDFTRLPVYENTQDNIVGFINVYEVLCSKKKVNDLYDFVKPIRKINQDTLVTNAMEAMQREEGRIALVVRVARKNHETPIGVITMKDLVEELFGELGSW